MEVRWERFLWPAALLSFLLLALPQAAFIWMSFHVDMGLGQVSDRATFENYVRVLTDPLYLRSFWLTVRLSVATTAIALLVGFPTAYVLARLGTWIASMLLGLLLVTSLVTVVIKLMGLTIILGPSGMINRLLLSLGVIASPLGLVNNEIGVLIGLLQYTLPILIMLLFGVIQTIPRGLEEAAEIHGATRTSTYRRVILPLARPGLVAGALIVFNMSMGAFTSAVLLGGGRVRTVPVLIQQKIIQSVEYAMGATLSTVLLVFVFAINLAVGTWVMTRGRRGRPSA